MTNVVEDTHRQLHEAEEATWRAAYKPHVITPTETKLPQPMFVAGVISVDRLLRVDFELAEGPLTYIKQALEGICEKLMRRDSDVLRTYGGPVGVFVDYAPDRAVRFDIDIPEGARTSTPERAHTSPI